MGAPIKRTIEWIAAGVGLDRLGRLIGNRTRVILCYHNVLPDSNLSTRPAAPPLHLPLEVFHRQVEYLQQHFDIVSLRGIVGSPPPDGQRPRVSLTFDDAYRGAVHHAIPYLANRGLPATIFVPAGFVAERSDPFWWDEWRPPEIGNDRDPRHEPIHGLQGDPDRIAVWARSSGWNRQSVPDAMCAASLEDLRRADGFPRVDFAAHGWKHRNISGLERRALEEELRDPLAWLQANLDDVVPWYAFPFGVVPSDPSHLARYGYEAALRLGGGWLPYSPETGYSLPRINIPAGLSYRGFQLRMGGWLCR